MSKPLLNVAIIGLGVGERHINVYESDERCKIVALCDSNEKKLNEIKGRYPDYKLTTNANNLLLDASIDIVSIASYDTFHAEQILLAINSGKHVFVEKPLCLHDEEFHEIDLALRKFPEVQLSSNLVLRRSPQFCEIKSRMKNGEIGKLFYMEADYNYGRLHKITEGWRGQIPFYSVVHGGAIHVIDLMLWLSQSKVVEVMALANNIVTENTQYKYPDMVTAILKFEDGMTAKVSANFGCVIPHHHSLAVYGMKSSFVYNYQGGVFYNSRDPKDSFETINFEKKNENKGYILKTFLNQIFGSGIADVSISETLDAMAISLSIERSIRSKEWEKVEYANARHDFN